LRKTTSRVLVLVWTAHKDSIPNINCVSFKQST